MRHDHARLFFPQQTASNLRLDLCARQPRRSRYCPSGKLRSLLLRRAKSCKRFRFTFLYLDDRLPSGAGIKTYLQGLRLGCACFERLEGTVSVQPRLSQAQGRLRCVLWLEARFCRIGTRFEIQGPYPVLGVFGLDLLKFRLHTSSWPRLGFEYSGQAKDPLPRVAQRKCRQLLQFAIPTKRPDARVYPADEAVYFADRGAIPK